MYALTTELKRVITSDQAWHFGIIPLNVTEEQVSFYSYSEQPDELRIELEMLFGVMVKLEFRDKKFVEQNLFKYYPKSDQKASSLVTSDEYDNGFLRSVIIEAQSLGSSDIHVEVYKERARIRLRIDGQLIEKHSLDKSLYNQLISVIKYESKLDIAEKRLPQDGRMYIASLDAEIELRVSILPTIEGEKVVMRILSNDAENLHLDDLGFSEIELARFREGITKPNGMVLISGPTGSGKTTTLYAALKELNKEQRNIMTVEDPIEYTLEGINQVQLKETIGLTFGEALKSFLRQDPDVIMLGEIRDESTGSMAIRASLTGHLVLSTIHTNSAWEIVNRLVDMGIQPFLVGSTLNLAIAQRLVRVLCANCCTEKDVDPQQYPLGFKPFYNVERQKVPIGCERCSYTGYKGRKAIYEIIPIDNEFMQVIKLKNDTFDLQQELIKREINTLVHNAFGLFSNGITSLEEIVPLLAGSSL